MVDASHADVSDLVMSSQTLSVIDRRGEHFNCCPMDQKMSRGWRGYRGRAG